VTVGVVADALAVVLLLGGLLLATIGLIGLVLKPNLFDQLHVAGLVTGPGVILVLLASVGSGSAEIVTSAVLVLAFVLVTSSISTHVIAFAGLRRYEAPSRPAPARPRDRPAPAERPAGGGAAAAAAAAGMRVVVAHDGTPAADTAVRLATALDWPVGTTIRLVAAVRPDDLPSIERPSRDDGAVPGSDRDRLVGELREAAGSVDRPGIAVEPTVVEGDAVEAVVRAAASTEADLLIASSADGRFVESLLGWSGSGDGAGRVPCPVLVARSASVDAVLLATDGSPESIRAVELVADWSIFDLSRIHVVTVAPGGPAPSGRPRSASPATGPELTVDHAAATLMDAGRDVATEVLRGRPGMAIVDAARAHRVDLIVMGSRGRTGLGRTLLGSVAGEVLGAAGASVLVVGPAMRRPAMRRPAAARAIRDGPAGR
jgi:nucleotide-binding universal stress UspA family protein/multisubunit Na+/H+ antiporter MnhG subunit